MGLRNSFNESERVEGLLNRNEAMKSSTSLSSRFDPYAEEDFYDTPDEYDEGWVYQENNSRKTKQEENDDYEIMDASGILEWIKQVEPDDFFIENLLTRGQVLQLYGEPKSGKSIVLQAIASALTKGQNFHQKIKTKKCNVLYMDGESVSSLRRRIAPMVEADKFDMKNFRIAKKVPHVLDPEINRKFNATLEELARDNFEVDVILVDSFSKMARGGDLINSTDMRTANDALKVIAEENNIAVAYIHHSIKNNEDKNNDYYGSVFNIADADSVIKLTNNNNRITLKNTHNREFEFNEDKPLHFDISKSKEGLFELEPVFPREQKEAAFTATLHQIIDGLKEEEEIKRDEVINRFLDIDRDTFTKKTLEDKLRKGEADKEWQFAECIKKGKNRNIPTLYFKHIVTAA